MYDNHKYNRKVYKGVTQGKKNLQGLEIIEFDKDLLTSSS